MFLRLLPLGARITWIAAGLNCNERSLWREDTTTACIPHSTVGGQRREDNTRHCPISNIFFPIRRRNQGVLQNTGRRSDDSSRSEITNRQRLSHDQDRKMCFNNVSQCTYSHSPSIVSWQPNLQIPFHTLMVQSITVDGLSLLRLHTTQSNLSLDHAPRTFKEGHFWILSHEQR